MSRPAAILCEGEGIIEVTRGMLADATVFAVNNALRLFPDEVDYWCAQDPLTAAADPDGRDRWTGLAALPQHRAAILTSRAQATQPGWHSIEVEETNLEFYYAGIEPTLAIPTFHATLMWALRRQFSPIRVYGAAMRGTGSPLTPWAPYQPDVDQPRWNEERWLLAQILAGWGGGRVQIVEPQGGRDVPSAGTPAATA